MARKTSTQLYSSYKREVWRINNGVPGPITATTLSDKGTASSLERSEIVKSPKVLGFRLPLPYHAIGSNRESASILAEGYTLANSGRRQHMWRVGGTMGRETPGALSIPPSFKQLLSWNERERLLVDLLKRVGDQKWSLGQAVVEARDAVSVIGSAARTLSKAMSAAVRKDWLGVARSLKVKPAKAGNHANDVSSGWLAYSFAWVPLVDDITHAALFLGGHLDSDKLLIMARGKITKELTEETDGSFTFAVTTDVISANYAQRDKYHSDVKMSLYYEIDRKTLYELGKYGVIGASTPWAVMPLSFLVDWVLPIGDFLAALDATIGLTYLGGSYTTFDKVTRTRKMISVKGASAGSVTNSAEMLWMPASSFEMERIVYEDDPVPMPLYIKDPFSVWKTVTSIALLKQFTKS